MVNLCIFRLCFYPIETKQRVIDVYDLMLVNYLSMFFYLPSVSIKAFASDGEDAPPKKSSMPQALVEESWREA